VSRFARGEGHGEEPDDPVGHPLTGITVVSIEQAIAAPFATRQLGELGARVIKIERTDGGDFARGYDETVRGLSSHFVWVNRGKESVALDLKQDEDRERALALVAEADVFVENLAPGAADRIGLGSAQLASRHPRLIACSISGFGEGGPYGSRKAYDLLVQSEAGLLSITGTPEAPSKAGIPVADIAAGMYAFSGVLTALYRRERTGQGAVISVSMLDALAEWMGFPWYFAHYGGRPPARAGSSHSAIAPYGAFATGSGEALILGIQNEREWSRFCSIVLEDPEVSADPRFDGNSRRVEHRAALDALIDAVFAELTADEVASRLAEAGIAYAHVRDVSELASHPQLVARERWAEVDTPAGPVQALLPPVSISGVDYLMGPVPALDEHGARIRAEVDSRGPRPVA
jgi:itaconate CoA-transferase